MSVVDFTSIRRQRPSQRRCKMTTRLMTPPCLIATSKIAGVSRAMEAALLIGTSRAALSAFVFPMGDLTPKVRADLRNRQITAILAGALLHGQARNFPAGIDTACGLQLQGRVGRN